MTRIAALPKLSRRATFDLTSIGIPAIPLLGVHHEKQASEGLHPHSHDAMELCYLVSGERVYHVKGRDYRFRGNELFVTYPGEVHGSGVNPHGKGILYWLHVKLPVRPASILGLNPAESWRLTERLRRLSHRRFLGDRRLKSIYEEVVELLKDPDREMARIEISARLVQWLGIVIRCAERGADRCGSADIRRVIEALEDEVDGEWSIGRMALLAGLSESRFKVKFKDQTGLPPAEFLARLRVKHAEGLLKAGRPVTEVAFAVGFSSSQYFATVFRRITGGTPTDVRRQAMHRGFNGGQKP